MNPQVGGCWGIKAPRILDIQWGIYARYESATGKVWSLNGLLEAVDSTIGVKQGCPLPPTLFGLYIDEVSHYIERFRSSRGCPMGIATQILHNALKVFCTNKGLSINMDNTFKHG